MYDFSGWRGNRHPETEMTASEVTTSRSSVLVVDWRIMTTVVTCLGTLIFTAAGGAWWASAMYAEIRTISAEVSSLSTDVRQLSDHDKRLTVIEARQTDIVERLNQIRAEFSQLKNAGSR
jgi:hypothetical protein